MLANLRRGRTFPSLAPIVRVTSVTDRNCMRHERIAPIARHSFAESPTSQSSEPDARTLLDNSACRWHQGRNPLLEPARTDETVSAQVFHMVEWPDLRHAIVDLAV